MTNAEAKRRVNAVLWFLLALNFAFWAGSRDIYAKWSGVPPVPTPTGAVMMTLGDPQFSFRYGALALQQLGDSGGRSTPIGAYDFAALGRWFFLLHGLDPASNHLPMVAAYYFGGVKDPAKVSVVVDYLEVAGNNNAPEKWRWLAHAVFLARYRMNDLDRALALAYKLSKLEPAGHELPIWARQMPAFVLKAQGHKDGARQIVEALLSSGEKFHPADLNFMRAFLAEQLGLSPDEVEEMLSRASPQ